MRRPVILHNDALLRHRRAALEHRIQHRIRIGRAARFQSDATWFWGRDAGGAIERGELGCSARATAGEGGLRARAEALRGPATSPAFRGCPLPGLSQQRGEVEPDKEERGNGGTRREHVFEGHQCRERPSRRWGPRPPSVLQAGHLAIASQLVSVHPVVQQLLDSGVPGVRLREGELADSLADTQVQPALPCEGDFHVRSAEVAAILLTSPFSLLCNIFFLFFFTLAPSYRLQDEQVGHFQAPPGVLRVPNSDG